MSELSYAQIDSRRFGLNIHRTPFMESLDVAYLLEYLLVHDVDTAIVRIPSKKLSALNSLDRAGMPYIIADTLAYYTFDLENSEVKDLANQDLEFIRAAPEHHDILNALVRATFGSYVNHYRINPLFDNESVTEGYLDWMRSYAEEDDDRLCWIIRKNGEDVGFGSFNFHQEGKVEGTLYGILPEHRRGGIFRDLIRFAQKYAKEQRQCTMMRLTTQIENVAAQRMWTKEGFELDHTVNTVHINATLSKSVFDTFDVPMRIDDLDWQSVKGSNRHLLKQINWNFDHKQNIVTRNHRFVNMQHSLQVGVEYTLRFSFPMGSKGLLRVLDQAGQTYMLVYFDLKHFVA